MTLRAAIGRYPHTAGLFGDGAFSMADFPVISRAFAPMVREQAFDVSEMAVATLLMARAAGSDLVLLPVVLAGRTQGGALLRRAGDRFGPEGLAGRRIGVRAFSQTTGMWVRGMLAEEVGLEPQECRWVTFEEAHVAGYRDPAWVERAAAGSELATMLRDGGVDAAIFGNEVPEGADLACVYPDPAAAGAAFVARHGFDPVNHMVVVRAEVAARPGQARAVIEALRAGNPYPIGRAALDPVVSLAARFAAAQGLTPRALALEEIWAGLPADCVR